ncbi:hypothetical protein DWG18_11110 [Lysobacter sp. TY2-98]|uniref:hypothetical protein n=1 Tax=Lysobacter sp. TY2-98 TaxID=2290922 RepID=UPI000E209F95|nr:hypothetical protein [Lysobacter sp. TY2-98]AXK72772.1 hypothetical protein DWG18_11110 [Lysobacter sp. TY2-98]
MNATTRLTRITQLEGIAVRAQDGSRLGHAFEIRSNGAAETQPTWRERSIDALLCGRLGLLERLGWREPDALVVPWEAVIARDERGLIVRGTRDDYTRT